MRFLAIVYLCWLPLCIDSVTNKYSSGCTVDQCDSSNPYGGCSSANPCFRFETSKNKTLCAPQVDCSLFDACTASKGCASNSSVCVINSCCSAPICMPMALSSACSRSGSSNWGSRWSNFGDVCINAIWSDIEEIVNTSIYNSMYSGSTTDFHMDAKNNFYISYSSNYNIIKFSANDTSSYKVVAYTYSTNNYASNKIFADDNGAVYSAESWTGYGPNGYNTYYRVVKYTENGNGTNTTVLFGDVICGQQLDQICQCTGLFVDNKGAIYYTDQNNHRVVLITPFSTTVTVVAGTTGSSGSANNQLYNPNGIYVDANNTLYVVDTGNNRVVMWPANSSNGTNGTVLFTTGSSHTPYQLTLDKAGNVYVSGWSSIYRFIRSVAALKSIVTSISSSMYGNGKVQLDTAGNIYTYPYNMYSNYQLWKYRFISNGC